MIKKKKTDSTVSTEPEPIPKMYANSTSHQANNRQWIEDQSFWLNAVDCDDKIMIFDEQKSQWCKGTVIKVQPVLNNANIDITLQTHYDGHSAQYDENIDVKFETTMYHKLRPKYTIKRTALFITSLFKIYEIDTTKKQQIITDGVHSLGTVDDIGREQFVQDFLRDLHEYKEFERQTHFTHKCTYFFHGFSRLTNTAWHQWRERILRNYPPQSPIVPDIEVGTRIPRYGYDVAQNAPTFASSEECNGDIVKYMFTNLQKIQKRMAMICYASNTFDKSLQKQLINGIKSLQRNNLDYRYPTKDLVIASKQSDGGEWFCDACFWRNTSQETNCSKCGSQRTQNMDGITPKTYKYDYGEIMKYHHDEYSKWKMRIQDLIDPLLNSERFWIPSTFHIDKESKVSIQSEIHNLPRMKYNNLYPVICKIFECMIPSFEWILGDIKLRNQEIEIIVGIQDYQLYPEQIFYGGLHREGYREETVEGVGIYYFDKSQFIQDDVFSINTETRGVCGSLLASHNQDIIVENGAFLVFNNKNLNHKLKILKNGSKIKFATRKILTFFIPEFRVKSVKKTIENNNDEIICNHIVANWIKLYDIKLFEMRVINIIILYSFDVIKQIKSRDKLRQARIKQLPVSEYLAWICLTN